MSTLECKVSQYADDTLLFLGGSRKSLQSALKMLKDYSLLSGLSVNNDKMRPSGLEH